MANETRGRRCEKTINRTGHLARSDTAPAAIELVSHLMRQQHVRTPQSWKFLKHISDSIKSRVRANLTDKNTKITSWGHNHCVYLYNFELNT